jgi:raffinose/stachyose/melibiose transport system substrate-binding protein
MRSRFTILLAWFLSVCVLFAAAAGGNEEKAQEPAGKPETQKVTLINYFGLKSKDDAIKAICDAVTAKYPHITFEIQGVPYAQYTGILKTRIAADDSPDLFTGWPSQYVELIRAGQVLDLSDKVSTKRLIPWLAKESTVDGRVYGFPLDVQIYGVFYNKDVFDRYGLKVPTTMDELIRVSDTLMANKVYPFVGSYKDANSPWVEYSTFAYPMLSQDDSTKGVLWQSIVEKKATFADYPAFAESLKVYNRLLKYVEPGDMGVDQAQGLMKLARGERAMYISGAWIVGDLYANNPGGRFGVFAPPWSNDPAKNRVGVGLDDVFMVNPKTKNMDGVDKFLDIASSDQGSTIWMETAKMLSSINGSQIPTDNDVQQDIGRILSQGREIPRSLLLEFAGEYRVKMRANIQLFAARGPAERNVEQFVKDLDAEFALIK